MQTGGNNLKGWLVPVLVLGLCVLLVSPPASASTPPYPPVLGISATGSLPAGSDLVMTVHWDRDGSYWVRPDSISVSLYGIPGGIRYAGWTLHRVESPGMPGASASYSLAVPGRELPAGEFMLVATDPLSGAVARRPVVLHGFGPSRAGTATTVIP